ncbi:hypothetical protein FB451DRAFT_1411615 [Mycena latifolia]|nr:hypothetical protein FB451DRAFT_1411615 [Mycena latifolia]
MQVNWRMALQGSLATSIAHSQTVGDKAKPPPNTVYQFSLEYVRAERYRPYGSVERLYSIYVNATEDAQYLTIQDDGTVLLSPELLVTTEDTSPEDPITPSSPQHDPRQLFVLTFDPLRASRNITASVKSTEAVGHEE